MGSFVLAGFGSMRGFGMPGVPNGFCGGIAILGANTHRPSVTNAGYSLSPAGARKLYNLMLGRGYCAQNGAQTIEGCFRGLSAIASGAHQLVDEAHFNATAYHEAVRGIITRKTAVITLWANGAALPGDEAGLHYHFTAIGGIDTQRPTDELIGGYAMCDDDYDGNAYPAQHNAPVWRTYPEMVAARPIAYIVCAA
jgi:hypothetical protein